ncbi:ABC transporter permease [Argonema antarcticum]|uniref:ABC transporter permease n=1 Tax=Argonema antarcticum TaxID=2942763 RepID=UPI0020137B51|nr:ABC transporter permease [Argonema antarcticum]MCL1472081.1 ABC transporter permease [Argonema antarcticum A004/B2]
MTLSLINRIGDWNPQLLRELKGRLKTRNVAIASAISLLGQLLLVMSYYGQLPVEKVESQTFSRYCSGPKPQEYYQGYECLKDIAGNFAINWQYWWLDVFVWLSLISIFTLSVVGTYMLIADLAQEDRRSTLNFIRLSPQSSQSILSGKLLGVPILLYVVGLLAIPLHLCAGISASIPLPLILTFYGVVALSCLLFYSAALLFGLFSSAFSGFQPWLGSGLVLFFLWLSSFKPITHDPTDWVKLFSPSWMISYLVSATSFGYKSPFSYQQIETWQWFYIPLGASLVTAVAFAVLNSGLWIYWFWQSMMRRFPNPSNTMLSKGQSYLLTASFEVMVLGFAMQNMEKGRSGSQWLSFNLNYLLFFNLFLFLCLIAALSPQRQALQDWARYRREKVGNRQRVWNSSLMRDLIWGEKSPNIMAIALNLFITSLPLICWILVLPSYLGKVDAFLSLALTVTVIAIYAAIAQLMLLMKTQKQAVWVAGALGAAIVLPPLIFAVLSLGSGSDPYVIWLFSAFPWVALTQHTAATTVFMAILGQFTLLAVLNARLSRQLRQAGESASKALLAAHKA